MQLTPHEVEHLGRLARLDLSSEEVERFTTQLSAVVEYVEQLASVEVPEGELLVYPSKNVMAADEMHAADSLARIERGSNLAGAPLAENGLFVVKAVMGGEVGSA